MTMSQKEYRIIEINNFVKNFQFIESEVYKLFEIIESSKKYVLPEGDLSISFLDTRSMCNVHKKFLSDSTLTDVITFPGSKEFKLAGEICISPEYALNATKIYNTSFSEELSLYLIHGYLHLAGLNDIEEYDVLSMREAEKVCLNLIKSFNAIPHFQMKL